MHKKILVLTASGFEDTELVTSLNVFRRNNVGYDLLSVENKELVRGQNNTLVHPTISGEKTLSDYDGVFLPGGVGHKVLLNSELVIELIQKYNQAQKLVAAICAAPVVLQKANVLGDKKFTSYPGMVLSANNLGTDVVCDQNVITGRDFESAIPFAKEIVKYLQTDIKKPS